MTGPTMPDGVRHDQAEQLIVYRRRAVAAQMRRGGASYQQIADTARYPTGELCYPAGTSRAQVYMDIKRGLAEAATQFRLETSELRELIASRLDDLYLRLHNAVKAGDVKAIAEARRIQADMARLYGVNEPEKVEVITSDALDVEIRHLRDEINRRAAVTAAESGGSTGPAGT